MTRFKVFLAVLLLLAATVPLMAQEQVGAVEGVIKDASGAVLPGVTMEATSPAIGTVTTTTDSHGNYRFPRLPSGTYTITASLMGYTTGTRKSIEIVLGKVATVNLSLNVATVSQAITVTAETPLVDVTQSAKTTSIAREQLEMLPKGRDFSSVVAFAPGASNEGFLAGISVDGASGLENRYVIDGIDITHPYNGVQGQNLVTDFVEEVQVKSAGYNAEYGGSLGGVINVITKTGTNDYAGWVSGLYQNSSWAGAARPSTYESAPGLYYTFPKDKTTRFEPGVALGGAIVKDKLWFFAGYNPATVNITRNPISITGTKGAQVEQKQKLNYFTGNIKGNIGSKFLYKANANLNPQDVNGVLPAADNSTPATTNFSVDTKYPTSSYSAYADYIPTSSIYFSGRGGHYKTDVYTSGVKTDPRILFSSGKMPSSVLPTDPLYRPAGFSSIPNASFQQTTTDLWKRNAGSFDASYFFQGFGQHSLKAGVQVEKISNVVSSGEVANLFRIYWGTAFIGVKGTYGAVAVRRFRTQGGADSNNLGLYLQDSWQIVPNFVVNIGVRTESEHIPNYGAKVDPTLPQWAMQWGFGDKVAPRLGFAWDVRGDQKLKVYGDYGLYYDIMKIDMARQSFGAAKWISYVYPLNTVDWTSLPTGCKTSQNIKDDNVCPALGTAVTRDFRKPTDPRTAIDPNLKPMENREYELGADYQLTPQSVFGFRYVNKDLLNTIEDIGYLDFATGDEIYTTGNPGKGIVAGKPPNSPVPAQPTAVRKYQAAEFSYNKRFGGNWSLRGTYTYSRLRGNYSGLASSDEFGRADPNIERYFDAITNAFDQNGQEVIGALNTDRPHQIKIQALYRTPWQMTVGVNQTAMSGTPVSEEVQYNLVPFFPHGRGNLGRTPNIFQTDLQLTQPFPIGKYRLEASVNVLNLFDSKTVTRIGNNHYRTDLADIAPLDTRYPAGSYEAFFGKPFDTDAIYAKAIASGNAQVDPFFDKPLAWQAARAVRVAVKFIF